MAPDLAQLTKDLQNSLSAFTPNNEKLRQGLLQSARNLVAQLETPAERIARMAYLDFSIWPTTHVLLDLKIFKTLAASDRPKSAPELAQQSGADARLVERLLKHVAVENFVHETGPDEYVANDLTRCIASPGGEGIIKDMFNLVKVNAHLPEYFNETGYTNPTDKDNSPWCQVMGPHYFEWVNMPGREDKVEAFHNHMRFKTLGLKWYEVPEIMEAVFGNEKLGSEDVLLVDVGGSTGHDILGFHQKHSDMTGRLILQDLPTSIENVDSKVLTANGIEALAHDFFTPQPVQHARAYYLKMCLHDWPAKQCVEILSNLQPAMKPGYSRILLNEIVIPEVNAGWFETSVDVLMMAAHSAQERREREWRVLVESVGGLRVKSIWDIEGAVEKVIEIELA